MVSQQTLNL